MPTPIPEDFIDRPWYQRLWIDFLVLTGRKAVKDVCCESFRKVEKMRCCKGCAALYHVDSPYPWYRFLGKIAKRKITLKGPDGKPL